MRTFNVWQPACPVLGQLLKRLPLDQSAVCDRTEALRIATVQYVAGQRDLLWVAKLQSAQLGNEAELIRLLVASTG